MIIKRRFSYRVRGLIFLDIKVSIMLSFTWSSLKSRDSANLVIISTFRNLRLSIKENSFDINLLMQLCFLNVKCFVEISGINRTWPLET